MRLIPLYCLVYLSLTTTTAFADSGASFVPQTYAFKSQNQSLQMSYLDAAPEVSNGDTVLLLHGKNFCAAYWQGTMRTLLDAGYRVVAPEQIGFCSSSLPRGYEYSFHQLADNTRGLLDSLDLDRVIVLGHSMGGMLATRFALMYPQRVDQLLLLDPIGLEDWKALGVPYQTVDTWYAAQRKIDFESIKRYQLASYYDGQWTPDYERWARQLAALYSGPHADDIAWSQALTYDMVYTQPVVYEFDQLQMPTVLMIGLRDRTALGKNLVSEAQAKSLGDYPQLGPRIVARIPDAKLVEFEGLGHLPHIEAPQRFYEALLNALGPSS